MLSGAAEAWPLCFLPSEGIASRADLTAVWRMTVSSVVSTTRFGQLLRRWRARRGMSQLALAEAAGTPARHVSFLETGRSRPGSELVLRLAEALNVPLRARNELLEAAGLAASYSQHRFSDAVLLPYRRAISHTLGALDPYPAIVIDRALNVVDANAAARRVFSLPEDGPTTLIELLFGSGGVRQLLINFPHVAWAWHDRLVRESSGDPEAEALIARVAEHLAQVPRPSDTPDGLLICPTFRVGEQVIETVGMSVRFAPSRDVTLQELAIEVLYPRDDVADAFFRNRV